MAAASIRVDAGEDVAEVVARIREQPGSDVTLTIPPGAEVGRSRFSLQLLAEYAEQLGKRVVVVSEDDRVVALARDCGLVAEDSMADSTAAIAAPAGWSWSPFTPGSQIGPGPRAPFEPQPAAGEQPDLEDADPSFATPPGPPTPTTPPSWGASAAAAAERAAPMWISEPAPAGEAGAARRMPARDRHRTFGPRTLWYALAVAVLVAGLLAVLLLVPSATVTLVAQSRPFSVGVDLSAQPGGGPISVRTQSEQKSVSGQFSATGHQTTPGAKAQGSVQYQDQCVLDGNVAISQGAVLVAQNGVQFVQQSDVTVSFGNTATAPIQAQSDGANGNVSANQVTTLQNAGVFSSCLQVSNPQPTSGGRDSRQQPLVTADDVSRAQAQLEQKATQAIQGDLQAARRANEKLSDQDPVIFATPSFQSDHGARSTVSSFDATLTLKGTAAYYRPAQVAAAFHRQLAAKVPSGQQLTQGAISAQYQTAGSAGGHLAFKGQAVGSIAPKLDAAQIRSRIHGETKAAALGQLHQLPVKQAEIVQHPFPLPVLPLLGSRIDVRYVVQEAPGPQAPPSPSPS